MSSTKPSRLVDFQIYARGGGLAFDEQREVNMVLFATFEPIRLWLKERALRAPFGKIVVTLSDEATSGEWHGHVANAVGVCEVTEVCDTAALRAHASDHRWVLASVRHALTRIHQKLDWRCAELEEHVEQLAARSFPLVHFFEALAATDKQTGTRCRTWFAVRPGHTEIGVRLEREKLSRDVIVASKDGPLYLEDDFDVAKARCRDGELVLLGRGGDVLARVPIVERSSS